MSGSTIGGVIGAAIGFVVTAGSPQGAMYGWMIGSAAGAILMPPQMEGPRLSDLRPQGSEYGRAIPLVYGTVAVSGNVIWQTDLVEVASESGGKGGPDVTSYTYYANFAVMICEADQINLPQLGRIWAGPEKRLIYDGSTLEGGGTITFYNGSETQLPDPLMEAHEGVGNVPAYRGFAYVVFENFPVANDGNRIPFLTIEVGNVTATPLEIDTCFSNAIFTDSTHYIVPLWGPGGYRVIIRNLADHDFVANYDSAGFDTAAQASEMFLDTDNNRLVQVSAGLTYMDLSTGTVVTTGVTIPEHVPSGAVGAGTNGRAGIYHNGLYICLCYPYGSATGRFTLTALDPADLSPVWTYTGDAGAPYGVKGPIYHKSEGDAFIFLHSTENKLRKVPLSASFASTLWGDTAAQSSNGYKSQQDPNTGKIWSLHNINSTSGPDQIYVTDLSTGVGNPIGIPDFTSYFGNPPGYRPFVFIPGSPNRALVLMSRNLSQNHDNILIFDADSEAFIGEAFGETAWIAGGTIAVGFYDSAEDQVWLLRGGSGFINTTRSYTNDTLTDFAVTDWSNATFPNSGRYLGDRGLSVQGTTLDLVVKDLCERAGLAPSEIDVTDLVSDAVDGYAIAQQTSVRGAIQVLMPAYFFDAVESGGIAKFVKRGGAVVVTIPDADLGAYQSGSQPDGDLSETRRQMDEELPRQLSVNYINRNADYETMTKVARRLVGSSGDEQTLDAPLVMTDTRAQGVADINLHQLWIRRKTYGFTLPIKYAYLEPTDVIVVRDQTMVLTRVTQANGLLKCEAAFDDFNYVPRVVVTETPTTGKTVAVPAETLLELM